MTPASGATPALRTGSLRRRTVVAVIGLVAVLLVVLAVIVDVVLGARLRAQLEDRLRDRAAAAASLVGTVDDTELADRLSAQGLSVLIESPAGSTVVAGPTPDQLRAAPPAGLPPRPGSDGSAPENGGVPGSIQAPAGPGQGGTDAGVTTGGTGATGTDAAGGATSDASTGTGTTGSGTTADAAASANTATSGATVVASDISGDADLVTLRSTLSDGSVLTLTASAADVTATLWQVRWTMAIAAASVLLVAVVAVVLVVRRTLRPLDRVTQAARSIARGDRARRLRPSRPRTEIGRVATAFDEMLDDVVGAEQQARDAEQRMRVFLADAAHELRTPIAGVRAAADTLVRADLGGAQREELAGRVAREATRASRLVDDLLTMARLDDGLDLDRRAVDLGAVLRVEADRQRLLHPSLHLRIDVPDGVAADVDPDRIAQVVANLVGNAARATAGRGQVTITLVAVGDEALVSVLDDGPGVPPADRERIFDRLVRLDPSRDGAGAGLGLAIARGLARAHGGDLVCAGTVGGARFDLSLPVGSAASVTPEPTPDNERAMVT